MKSLVIIGLMAWLFSVDGLKAYSEATPSDLPAIDSPALKNLEAPLAKGQSIDFVYVHGVNTHKKDSDKIIKSKFTRFHQSLLNSFEKDPLAKKVLLNETLLPHSPLENAHIQISKTPSIFYWNQLNQGSIEAVHDNLNIFKSVQSRVSSLIQFNLATMMQDVFWLVKRHNQIQFNDSLNHHLREKVDSKHQVVLFGYSGGSVISYEYLLYYLPYIDMYEVLKRQKAPLPADIVESFHPEEKRYACLQALLDSDFSRFNRQGDMVLFFSELQLKNMDALNQIKLDYTREKTPLLFSKISDICLPPNRIRGLVTFGSPLTALTSSSTKNRDVEAKAGLAMVKYFFEHDIFWLNLNRLNDPLGLPLDENAILTAVQEKFQWDTPKTPGGFIYNNGTGTKGALFYNAHMWYLEKPDIFATFVSDSLKEGYQKFYHDKLQK
ncbi:MAG: hypothetical protein K2X66_14525 [Cyanobacteria bacterium]|nr:hypothetical protein [Cyanobacteriota bacterium]